jgi:hypothetical protein
MAAIGARHMDEAPEIELVGAASGKRSATIDLPASTIPASRRRQSASPCGGDGSCASASRVATTRMDFADGAASCSRPASAAYIVS